MGLNLFQKLPEGPMKLYFLYLLIASIAMLAHFGARQAAESTTDEASV